MSNIVEIPALPLEELLRSTPMEGPGNTTTKVYRLLRQLIVEVRLLPGRALPEKEVAALLNVSKTPVREAIIRLSEEGLVKVVPQGGTFVATIEVQRYIEACFIRFRLESGAAAEAAKRHTLEDLGRLELCLNQQVEAVGNEDYTRFFELDEEFHRMIFSTARLSGVWAFVNQAKGEIDRMRHLKMVFGVRRTGEVIHEHRDIVDAIRAASPDEAVAAMTRHLGSLEAKITELSRNPKLWSYIESINATTTEKRKPRRSLT
ncbi:GntR family transcriptional regulator [Ensifer sp. Root278]|uniref:GntR family transcriptional regulator n=1 Tax=Ensifer sp. Root278 TaxID=1736509 RepID=UPI000A459A8B|nr:GntR family transcriptional regulator [Ensifer sp. Root278]